MTFNKKLKKINPATKEEQVVFFLHRWCLLLVGGATPQSQAQRMTLPWPRVEQASQLLWEVYLTAISIVDVVTSSAPNLGVCVLPVVAGILPAMAVIPTSSAAAKLPQSWTQMAITQWTR